MSVARHIDLDGAWPLDALPDHLNCREWGPALRYSTTREEVARFFAHVETKLTPFTLYGSGDFHYLSALWLRQIAEPCTLVSFDNHPDWDIRPPHWCCGTWINRALELPQLRQACVWGCGNFELNWPSRLFASHDALRAGRLRIWPWRDRISASARKTWPGLVAETWRAEFSAFARSLADQSVYVTVDLDCLRRGAAVTNWEQGLFTREEVAWALRELRGQCRIAGGDVCGAWSSPAYERFKQRIEANLDHPKLEPVDPASAQRSNQEALAVIWPALLGG